MSDLHLVQFSDPQLFVETVKAGDHSFFNFTLGSLFDSLDEEQVRIRNLTDTSRSLFGVYKGDTLLYVYNVSQFPDVAKSCCSITLTKIADDFAWVLSSPLVSKFELDIAQTSPAVYLLASRLPTMINPKSLDAIVGQADLVAPFLVLWETQLAEDGIHVESISAVPTSYKSKITYATLATIPPPSPVFASYRIGLAAMNDIDELAHLYVGFTGVRDPNSTSLDDAQGHMKAWVQLGQIWVCRLDGDIAGYIATGRTTPRTVAIRNVYVAPKHRRKGIAEAMTRAVTRYMLGAEPLGFEGAPTGGPPTGPKEQVCLNVAEEHVARLYKKCGFLLGDDDRDPVTGAKGWIYSSFQTIAMSHH